MKIDVNFNNLSFKENLVAKTITPIIYKVLYFSYIYYCKQNNIEYTDSNYELYCQYILDKMKGVDINGQ